MTHANGRTVMQQYVRRVRRMEAGSGNWQLCPEICYFTRLKSHFWSTNNLPDLIMFGNRNVWSFCYINVEDHAICFKAKSDS